MSKNDKPLFESPYSRHFTHLAIPAEIWLRKDISLQAKCLWAEIASLYCPEAGGCYASEEYLCEFMDLKRSRLHEVMKQLKDKGLLIVVKNDGRKCIRKAIMDPEMQDRALQKSGKPDKENPGSRTKKIRDPGLSTYIYNKADNKEEREREASSLRSSPCVRSSTSSSSPKVKASPAKKTYGEFGHCTLTDEEYKKLTDKFGESATKKIIEEMDLYVESTGKKYRSSYATLLNWKRREKENPKNGIVAPHREKSKLAYETKVDTWQPKYINRKEPS